MKIVMKWKWKYENNGNISNEICNSNNGNEEKYSNENNQ